MKNKTIENAADGKMTPTANMDQEKLNLIDDRVTACLERGASASQTIHEIKAILNGTYQPD